MTIEDLVQMTNHALLNNIDHANVKVITTRDAEYGDNVWYAQTFAHEFRSVQSCYPIMFTPDPASGKLVSVALFGFKNEENLFLKDGKWDACYIPLSVQRMPFYIGFKKEADETQRVITIDLDSPRISETHGISLFSEYGGNSDYLDNIAGILETLHQGLVDNDAFLAVLDEYNLLEPVTLDIETIDGKKHQLLGFSTINEDKLASLSSDILTNLLQRGYLSAIYMVIASQTQFQKLVALKNKRLIDANELPFS